MRINNHYHEFKPYNQFLRSIKQDKYPIVKNISFQHCICVFKRNEASEITISLAVLNCPRCPPTNEPLHAYSLTPHS